MESQRSPANAVINAKNGAFLAHLEPKNSKLKSLTFWSSRLNRLFVPTVHMYGDSLKQILVSQRERNKFEYKKVKIRSQLMSMLAVFLRKYGLVSIYSGLLNPVLVGESQI